MWVQTEFHNCGVETVVVPNSLAAGRLDGDSFSVAQVTRESPMTLPPGSVHRPRFFFPTIPDGWYRVRTTVWMPEARSLELEAGPVLAGQ
jgi:hypothetical protein